MRRSLRHYTAPLQRLLRRMLASGGEATTPASTRREPDALIVVWGRWPISGSSRRLAAIAANQQMATPARRANRACRCAARSRAC
jgi:hypothetical protein